jgi:hypothetical protein
VQPAIALVADYLIRLPGARLSLLDADLVSKRRTIFADEPKLHAIRLFRRIGVEIGSNLAFGANLAFSLN